MMADPAGRVLILLLLIFVTSLPACARHESPASSADTENRMLQRTISHGGVERDSSSCDSSPSGTPSIT